MADILQADHPTSLITGAASGIGKAIAQHAYKEGHNLILVDIDEINLIETSDQFKTTNKIEIIADLSSYEDISKLKKTVDSQCNVVNYLFNNAGIFLEGRSWKLSSDAWSKIININLLATIRMTSAFLPSMIESNQKCHVVNTASMAGVIIGGYLSPYTTTKHAVVGYTRSLFEELKDVQNVNASVLCPGEVKSQIINNERSSLDLKKFLEDKHETTSAIKDYLKLGVKDGLDPKIVAKEVFNAIKKNNFWIFTHSDFIDTYLEYSKEIIESMKR